MPTTLVLLDRALRLDDNPTLNAARHTGQPLIVLVDTPARPPWLARHLPMNIASDQPALARTRAWQALAADLARFNVPVWQMGLASAEQWQALIEQSDANQIFAPAHADPDQQRLLASLSIASVCCGDNHLLSRQQHQTLPAKLLGRFTPFYHAVKHWPTQSLEASPQHWVQAAMGPADAATLIDAETNVLSSVKLPVTPEETEEWLERYLWQQQAVLHYKSTRNDLMGDYSSSRLSAALAMGAFSVRRLNEHLQRFEHSMQSNASTAALRYEWYWREYFQWLGGRLGDTLYQAPVPVLTEEQQDRLHRWCKAQSGVAIVDAAMTELQQTGFLSNRARQLAASCLVHDLAVPWQYGAAWFEHNLIDFDPNSNTGNWAYIAGGNAVSNKPHAFDLEWQTQQHDPRGLYRATWL